MEKELFEFINNCLNQYVGGRPFYDAIDNEVRTNKVYMKAIVEKALSENNFEIIVVSGSFGREFYKYISKNAIPVEKIIILNGGLKRNAIENPAYDFNNKKVIFIEDSSHSRGTINKVKEYIATNNGQYIKSYIFYDGSREKESDIDSFYRYYDYH